MSTVRILAIDPGSNCGYAVIDVAQPVPTGAKARFDTAGLWDLQQKKFEGAGMRYLRLRKHIMEIAPDFVVYEQVNFPHKSTQAAAVYWGIVGQITAYCEEAGIAYAAIMTGDLKRRATGKGGGKGTDKPFIVAAANKFFEIGLDETDSASNKDHNIADAMWLLQIALEEYGNVVKAKGEPSA